MHVCAPHVSMVARDIRKRALDSLELELRMVKGQLIKVLDSLHEQGRGSHARSCLLSESSPKVSCCQLVGLVAELCLAGRVAS